MIIKNLILFIIDFKRNCTTINLSPLNFLVLLSLNLLILIFLEIFETFIMLPEFQHTFYEDAEEIFEMIVFFLLWIGVITPVIEEFIFRYFLVGNNFRKVMPSIFLVLLFSFFAFSGGVFGGIMNLICLIYFLVIIIIFLVPKGLDPKIVVSSSILLFGVYHLQNFQYEEIKNNFIYVPVLIFPQIILGYFLVFLRVNFGLIYAIIYHGVYNTTLLSIIYFLYLFTGKIY